MFSKVLLGNGSTHHNTILHDSNSTDLPTSPESTIATFSDNTAVLATDSYSAIASQKLQTTVATVQNWF